MPYPLVIFDLDGTLADSLPWFLRNVNGVAERFSFRRVAEEDIEVLRGLGSREILRRLKSRCGNCLALRDICDG
jgi:phosphoglycolate phosphatase